MKTSTKVWLAAAAILILVGGGIFAGAMMKLNWDFTALSSSEYETNRHEISNTFKNISLETDTANILLLPAEDGKTAVVCYEMADARHSVSVEGETLVVKAGEEQKKWQIGFNFEAPQISIYLPAGQYGALSARTDTGHIDIPADFAFESIDITSDTGDVTLRTCETGRVKIRTHTGYVALEGMTAAALDLGTSTGNISVSGARCEGELITQVSTGRVKLRDVSCQSLTSTGSTGDITMDNVTVSGRMTVERSTGDVSFNCCDAAEISVTTDTGDVTGSLRTEKIFFAQSDTGSVSVPRSTEGGICEISTDTGDIDISIE